MSTYERVRHKLIREGRLVVWQAGKHVRQEKLFLVTPELHGRLERAWGSADDEMEARRQEVRATIESFVSGAAPVSLLFKLIGGRKRVAEMRILSPGPGVRILGGFVKDDVFVGIVLKLREEVPFKRQPNPGTKGQDWRAVKAHVEQEWQALFSRQIPSTKFAP